MKHCWLVILRSLFLVALLPVIIGCEDDLQNEFTRQRAFFRFPMVNTTPELRSALNSPGIFCKITFPPQSYLFTDAQGRSTQVSRTSLEVYGKPIFISGFIVGTPAIPDLSGNFFNVAYDLVCPFCYTNDFIDRSLDFNKDVITEMKCGRCGRIYDLNNDGIVKNGEEKHRLFRYRMNYSATQGTLFIQN